jgi:hypothetical protein
MADAKKIANNILDFLIDPTKIPVKERVYFRPEENLKNEIYETTKADVAKAYKDQKHNSDFYPSKNRQMREATLMDRKSLIASFDILSRNFTENDPIGKDLRTMAAAVAKMKDEELAARQASDAPDFDGMTVEAKAKTFPCPKCGTKVLEATSYCIKCKKKVKPGKKASDDDEAPAEEPAKDEPKDEQVKDEEPEVKKDDEVEASDFWTKEAMNRVAKGLVSDVVGMSQDEEDEEATAKKKDDAEEEEVSAKKVLKDEEVEAKKKAPAKEEEVSAKKDPKDGEMDEKDAAKAKKDEEVEAKKAAAPAEEEMPEEKQPPVDEEKKSTVDTDILASITFGDISLDAPILEAGAMTEEEKATLAGLFN